MSVYAAICFNDTDFASWVHPAGNAHSEDGGFFGVYHHHSTLCGHDAHSPYNPHELNVAFEYGGLGLRTPSRPVRTAPPTAVVHVVRAPIDMVVSGYFFHRSCAEPFWTQRVPPPADKVPRGLAANMSLAMAARNMSGGGYCAWLRALPLEDGIRAEMQRTLGAADGVRKMLNDVAVLRLEAKWRHLPVLQVCLDAASEPVSMAALQRFVAPWIPSNRTVSIVDLSRLHTRSSLTGRCEKDAAARVANILVQSYLTPEEISLCARPAAAGEPARSSTDDSSTAAGSAPCSPEPDRPAKTAVGGPGSRSGARRPIIPPHLARGARETLLRPNQT